MPIGVLLKIATHRAGGAWVGRVGLLGEGQGRGWGAERQEMFYSGFIALTV